MPKILALDISSSAGWALFEDSQEFPLELGSIVDNGFDKHLTYPESYRARAHAQAIKLWALVFEKRPDVVVIEETNLGKARYSQKLLEMIHGFFLQCSFESIATRNIPIVYVSSSAWRKTLQIGLSKDDRKNNAKLSRMKSAAKGDKKLLAKLKKQSGVRGKIGKKHVAVRYVNERFDKDFIVKDNDICDAICLGLAYIAGAEHADGNEITKRKAS